MSIALHRILRRIEVWDADYGGTDEVAVAESDRSRADVVTSQLAENPKLHAPLFDLDIPHFYYPSSTQGHGHLYLDKPVTWRQFKRVLRAMYLAGLIEKGYYQATKRRGYATLRLPEKPKEERR